MEMTTNQTLNLDHDHDFGTWRYVARNRTLVTRAGGYAYEYEIDLEKIHSSAEMLDWIFQLHNKGWADRTEVVADLVRAFEEIFDPQANLCSFGQDRRLPFGFLRRPGRR